ncbi:hypothetical protein [Thiorhodospira sibirica]|uniref:hypothetical protein n=1 Tax=Thiorhodospira sibirica TaxID=154347 RepID=UPI00022C33C2|nr:hypothetical protein [Thiorhodospira sibirica]
MFNPRQYLSHRLIFFGIAMLVALLGAFWITPQGEPTLRQQSATVLEVNEGSATSLRTGSPATLVTIRVLLPDDTQTRVQVFGIIPAVGDTVTLFEAEYPDGTRRYRMTR